VSRESTKARRSARRRVFVADPPLASLVDEAVAQLKIHRQYPTHRRRNRGLLLGLRLSHRLVAVRLAPRPGRHAMASPPIRCQSRSSASAPSRSCRRSRASPSRRTGSVEGHSPGAPSPRQRGRCRTSSRANSGAPRGRGRMRVSRTRRNRALHVGAGRVGRQAIR